jgi:cytochrome c
MALRKLSAGTALALALGLAACSGGETPPEEPAATETPVAAAPALEATPAAEPSAAAPPVPEATATATPAADKAAAAAPAAAKAPPAAAPAAEVVKVAATVAPPASFGRCAVCHSAEKGGGDKLGPNLHGVYGKPAGKGSFAFSSAFKEAGLVLDEATLHKWLENPKALVPGNRMSFPGIKDAAKRQEIIDYLKQQS